MTNQLMDKKIPAKSSWKDWDQFLQQWGFKETAAIMIDSAGPMNIFLAQILHFGNPFLRLIWPDRNWEPLAEILEDRQQSRDFAAYLRSKENA
jgi:hypothetical protein